MGRWMNGWVGWWVDGWMAGGRAGGMGGFESAVDHQGMGPENHKLSRPVGMVFPL